MSLLDLQSCCSDKYRYSMLSYVFLEKWLGVDTNLFLSNIRVILDKPNGTVLFLLAGLLGKKEYELYNNIEDLGQYDSEYIDEVKCLIDIISNVPNVNIVHMDTYKEFNLALKAFEYSSSSKDRSNTKGMDIDRTKFRSEIDLQALYVMWVSILKMESKEFWCKEFWFILHMIDKYGSIKAGKCNISYIVEIDAKKAKDNTLELIKNDAMHIY